MYLSTRPRGTSHWFDILAQEKPFGTTGSSWFAESDDIHVEKKYTQLLHFPQERNQGETLTRGKHLC